MKVFKMATPRSKLITLLLSCTLFSFPGYFASSDDNAMTQRSSYFTLRDNCYLPGHVIHSTTVTSSMECAMHCNILFDDCQSWNMIQTVSGYLCELLSATEGTENTLLVKKEGAKFGQRLVFPKMEPKSRVIQTFLFSSLGAIGRLGPTDVSGYDNTSLQGQVTLNSGIQEWTVPQTGTYEIEAYGASGSNGTCSGSNQTQLGGLGARMKGTFSLAKETMLRILVGQSGTRTSGFRNLAGGGGGGTYVTFADNTPLIIAGGGGGGGSCIVRRGASDGEPGQQEELGSQCQVTAGQGGIVCSNNVNFTARVFASGGAGLLGDGNGKPMPGPPSFSNGGTGGNSNIGAHGGFGGGGYGWTFGGGGGGYSGGGVWGNSTEGVAGGGGSFNNGLQKEGGVCDSKGNGLVKIDLVT